MLPPARIACLTGWLIGGCWMVVGPGPAGAWQTTEKPPATSTEQPVDIGNRRELFVDSFLIDSLQNCQLEMHHPVPAEIVIRFDRPWEGAFAGYGTVIFDDPVYRMYYRGLPESGKDGTNREVTCYAESADGIHWTKPDLGLYEYHGDKRNNIVLMNQAPLSHNFAPFLDRRPNVPANQRFKALAGTESSGLVAFASPDGRRWQRLQEEPVFRDGMFDSQNISFWSDSENRYVCYFRTWTGEGYSGFRTVSRTTSDDFLDWSAPEEMQFGDTPAEHLYTSQTTPYFRAPHIGVALAARFVPGRRVLTAADQQRVGIETRYAGDCSDTVLMTTRGGDRFDRTFMESFVRPGPGAENWVSRSNYMVRGIVPNGADELSIYLSRNYGQDSACLQRLTLRTDGFASLAAGFEGGQCRTRVIRFRGDGAGETGQPAGACQLTLNVSTSAAGGVEVALLKPDGTPIPGFSFDDCDTITGDAIDRVVSWSGQSDVSRLSGQPLRLAFRLQDADVFSFRFR